MLNYYQDFSQMEPELVFDSDSRRYIEPELTNYDDTAYGVKVYRSVETPYGNTNVVDKAPYGFIKKDSVEGVGTYYENQYGDRVIVDPGYAGKLGGIKRIADGFWGELKDAGKTVIDYAGSKVNPYAGTISHLNGNGEFEEYRDPMAKINNNNRNLPVATNDMLQTKTQTTIPSSTPPATTPTTTPSSVPQQKKYPLDNNNTTIAQTNTGRQFSDNSFPTIGITAFPQLGKTPTQLAEESIPLHWRFN